MSPDLKRRLAVAGVGIPLGVFLIYLGGWALGVTLAIVAALGTAEFYALAMSRGRPTAESASTSGGAAGAPPAPAVATGPGRGGAAEGGVASPLVRPFHMIGVPASVLLVLLVTHDPHWARLATTGWSLILVVLILALGASVFLRGPEGAPLAATSATVGGVLYTGGTLAFGVLIRHLPDSAGAGFDPWHGTLLLIFPLTAAWVGDSAAYFIGSRWGRRKLFPSASPKKSVEGAIAGLGGSTLVGVLFGIFALGELPAFAISPVSGAVIGLLIGIAAQVGDLAESVLKRDAGVKDSGRLLPGHGGVLDRFDGILVTLPLAWLLIVLNRWLVL